MSIFFCTYLCTLYGCLFPIEARIEHRVCWTSHSWLWAAMWVQGTTPLGPLQQVLVTTKLSLWTQQYIILTYEITWEKHSIILIHRHKYSVGKGCIFSSEFSLSMSSWLPCSFPIASYSTIYRLKVFSIVINLTPATYSSTFSDVMVNFKI